MLSYYSAEEAAAQLNTYVTQVVDLLLKTQSKQIENYIENCGPDAIRRQGTSGSRQKRYLEIAISLKQKVDKLCHDGDRGSGVQGSSNIVPMWHMFKAGGEGF